MTPVRSCPQCGGEVRERSRVCPACTAPLDGATQTIFQQSSSASASIDEGRFPAGTVLAGRYRILGQGGMGEVCRAFDLILNQAVALIFLAGATMSEAALARFRNEVRIAPSLPAVALHGCGVTPRLVGIDSRLQFRE